MTSPTLSNEWASCQPTWPQVYLFLFLVYLEKPDQTHKERAHHLCLCSGRSTVRWTQATVTYWTFLIHIKAGVIFLWGHAAAAGDPFTCNKILWSPCSRLVRSADQAASLLYLQQLWVNLQQTHCHSISRFSGPYLSKTMIYCVPPLCCYSVKLRKRSPVFDILGVRMGFLVQC